MTKRIFAIERSPLARNVYALILSRIGENTLVPSGSWDDVDEFQGELEKADLVILSESTVGERKNQLLSMLCQMGRDRPPCIIFCHRGSKGMWGDYSKLDRMFVIERPFYPDDFLKIAETIWENL